MQNSLCVFTECWVLGPSNYPPCAPQTVCFSETQVGISSRELKGLRMLRILNSGAELAVIWGPQRVMVGISFRILLLALVFHFSGLRELLVFWFGSVNCRYNWDDTTVFSLSVAPSVHPLLCLVLTAESEQPKHGNNHPNDSFQHPVVTMTITYCWAATTQGWKCGETYHSGLHGFWFLVSHLD